MPKRRRRSPQLSREEKVQQWVNLAAIHMGIGDWRIAYKADVCVDCDDGTILACIHPDDRYRSADLRLAARFWEQEPFDQRETLAHELCHLFTARVVDVIALVRKELPLPVYSIWQAQVSDAEEFAVDAMARALAPALPLPRF